LEICTAQGKKCLSGISVDEVERAALLVAARLKAG
jgi:hypothetical protein